MPFSPTDTNAPSQGQWGGDFTGQLGNILAPYQQMAQQMQSPYATMSPNSWIAQNHPKLAGFLDNAFLTAGLTPAAQGPEGVGGGIARTFQGLIAAPQFRRQQMMETAMMPYKMAMGQLQARDVMSQTAQREAEAPYYQARGRYYDAKMEEADRPRLAPGGLKTDASGQDWHEVFDPTNHERPSRLFNPSTGKYADELPSEQQPDFTKAPPLHNVLAGGSGGILGQLAVLQTPRKQGEDDTNYSKRVADAYVGLYGKTQGTATGAKQAVTQPAEQSKQFLADERKDKYSDIDKKYMSISEFERATDPLGTVYGFGADRGQKLQTAFEAQNKNKAKEYNQRDILFNQWERSPEAKSGVGFHEWVMKNPGGVAGAPNTAAPSQGARPKGW